MSKPAEYVYDVAFSFLAADEPVARKIDEALESLTLKRFLYTDRQKELVGKDGVEEFSRTFRRDSRVAVVLHRKGWGGTKWTAIEASAIRSRALDDMNFDSVLFVPLDDSQLPDWVPPQRIFFQLGTSGHAELAAAIAQKAKEAGSEVRKIGIGLAHAAAAELQKEFARFAAEASVPPLTLKYEQTTRARGGQGEGAVTGPGHSASFFFRPHYANSLDGAELTVEIWKGPSPLLGRSFISEEPKCLNSSTYEFDLAPDGSTGWRKGKGRDGQIVGSAELAEKTIEWLLDAIGKNERKRGR